MNETLVLEEYKRPRTKQRNRPFTSITVDNDQKDITNVFYYIYFYTTCHLWVMHCQ